MDGFSASSRNLKIGIAAGLLFFFSVFFYALDYIKSIEDASQSLIFKQDAIDLVKKFEYIPFSSLAGACVEVLFIALLFELWIRRESEAEFKASLFDPEIIDKRLSQFQIDEILVHSINRRYNEMDFSREVAEFISSGALSSDERRYDASYKISLFPLAKGSGDDVETHFFECYLTYEYTKRLSARTLRFICLDNAHSFNDALGERTIEWRWLDSRKRLFPRFDENFYSVENLTVDGEVQVIKVQRQENGDVTYRAVLSRRLKIGEIYRFVYRIRIKLESLSNCFFVDVREPTKSISVDFDYGNVPISHVNVFDSFSSNKHAQITYTPPDPKVARSVRVIIDKDWVIPKSGVLFSWILNCQNCEDARHRHLESLRTLRDRQS